MKEAIMAKSSFPPAPLPTEPATSPTIMRMSLASLMIMDNKYDDVGKFLVGAFRANIKTFSDIVAISESDLVKRVPMRPKDMERLKSALAHFGWKLPTEPSY